jgi:hypothetical protein
MPVVETGEIVPVPRSTFHALRTSRHHFRLLSGRTTAKNLLSHEVSLVLNVVIPVLLLSASSCISGGAALTRANALDHQ